MPGTNFSFTKYDDYQELGLFGLRGRVYEDGRCKSNHDAHASGLSMVRDELKAADPADTLEWFFDWLNRSTVVTVGSEVRVTAQLAMMLFFAGMIPTVSAEQMCEDAGEVIIRDAVGQYRLTLRVMSGDHTYAEDVISIRKAMLAW